MPKCDRRQLTPEAFRELAETTTLAVYENADSLELLNLQEWGRLFKQELRRQFTYEQPEAEGAEVGE